MSIQSSMKNAALISGAVVPVSSNAPGRYGDRQRQYFDGETRRFTQEMARYSSDFVSARVQGLDLRDPLGWGTYRLRLANVLRPQGALTRSFDDYKLVLFESRAIEYIPPGAKLVTMGNTWLAVNPDNLSGGSGSGIVRRCNAVWNHLDWYGRVVSEPVIVENRRADANDSDAQASQLITKGYFNIICQYNADTAQLNTNSRLILGSGAYRITGFSDFEQEFTGDYESVRLLFFTARYEEPNAEIDDLTRHIAEGRSFTWDVAVSGTPILAVGQTARFSAQSFRNGEIVSDSPERPLSYLWSSSDENVAVVDPAGNVTARAEGEAVISAVLQQNMELAGSFAVTVGAAESAVRFLSEVPGTLRAFDECEIAAAFFEDGVQTEKGIAWSFSGADAGSYGVLVGPRAVTVTCYGYSAGALTVTASCDGVSASVELRLKGI